MLMWKMNNSKRFEKLSSNCKMDKQKYNARIINTQREKCRYVGNIPPPTYPSTYNPTNLYRYVALHTPQHTSIFINLHNGHYIFMHARPYLSFVEPFCNNLLSNLPLFCLVGHCLFFPCMLGRMLPHIPSN